MSRKKVKSFAAHAKDARWAQEGLRPYFTYRDLGIKDATEGKVLAHIIRAHQPCTGPLGYHSHDLDFQMVYLINGWPASTSRTSARFGSKRVTRGINHPVSGMKFSNTPMTGK